MEESRPLSQVKTYCGSANVCCNYFENPAFWTGCLFTFTFGDKATPAPMKLPNMRLNKKIPQNGELGRFFHQNSQYICEPLLLKPERSYQNHKRFVESITLIMTCLRRAKGEMCTRWESPTDAEKSHASVPWDLEQETHTMEAPRSHLLQASLYRMWMTEHLTCGVEHPGKKGPLDGKDLLWMAQLIH